MILKKRKIFFNHEKEERWLNEMAAKGYHLVHYSWGKYTFEKGTPGEYIYRLELLDELPSHPESKDYIQFMEEQGVQCVATSLRWVFFRKKAKDGPFEIYSDHASRLKHYQKIAGLLGLVCGINLLLALVNFNSVIHLSDSTFVLYVSLVNWLAVILLAPLFISYWRRINRLKKEMELYHK